MLSESSFSNLLDFQKKQNSFKFWKEVPGFGQTDYIVKFGMVPSVKAIAGWMAYDWQILTKNGDHQL